MNNVEIERKYIIEIPDFNLLAEASDYTVSEIEQIYLSSPSGITHRIRRRAFADRIEYTETKKVRIDKTSAYEDERKMGKGVFADCYDLGVICCAAPEKPDGWDDDWLTDCDARVEWSATDED